MKKELRRALVFLKIKTKEFERVEWEDWVRMEMGGGGRRWDGRGGGVGIGE